MIKDEKQYEYTQHLVREFEKSIAAMERDEERKKNDPQGWELIRGALQCHRDRLQAEVDEYEMLTSHDYRTPIVLQLDDIYYLAQIIIKARMAAKLSEKELGALAGITEEKIKHYEENDYQDASFQEVKSLMMALEIAIQKCEMLVPLDTLRRTPVTKEELLSSRHRKSSDQSQQMIG